MKTHNGYSELMVLHSSNGYYIGRKFIDPDGSEHPGSRESAEYYETAWQAEHALVNGTYSDRGHP